MSIFSNANYRQPYWKQDYGLLHDPGTEYIGYHPTFDGTLGDYNGTKKIEGKEYRSIFREYADAVAEGLKKALTANDANGRE